MSTGKASSGDVKVGESEVVAPVATPEVVKPETTLVVTKGVGLDLGRSGGFTFLPSLSQDMDLSVRKDVIRSALKQAATVTDKLGLAEGELLYEASKNGYWKDWTFTDEKGSERPYAEFKEYCSQELGMDKRKAYYLISIYEKFVVDLNLPAELLRELEWSKAKELVPVITEANAADLMDKIGKMSKAQVIDMVKAMKAGSGTGAGPSSSEPVKTMSFKLKPEQYESVENALKVAQTMCGSDKTGNQLDLICSDFIATSVIGTGAEGALLKLETAVKNLERSFHVKLNVEAVDPEHYEGLSKDAIAPIAVEA